MSCSEDEMNACLKASVLDENRPLLCRNLDPRLHFPYLRSKYVLSEDDEELIEVQQLKKLKVHKLIDILMKKGKRGFDELIISIIQEKTQLFLAEKLNKDFEEKKKRLQGTHTALTASNSSTGTFPVESTGQGNTPTEKVEHVSVNTPEIMDLSSETGSQTDKNRNSVPLRNSWMSSISDLGVDTEKLPKPVMPKKTLEDDDKTDRWMDGLVLSRKKSCENSFDEDLDDIKSLPDSIVSVNESKA